jgi:hypothetical protein
MWSTAVNATCAKTAAWPILLGVYMPGRDRKGMLDMVGWVAVIGSLLGVTLHGLGRIFTGNGRKED